MSKPWEESADPDSDLINGNSISYYIRLEYNTDKAILLHTSLHLDATLTKKYMGTIPSIYQKEPVCIEPKKGFIYNINSGLARFVDEFSESEYDDMIKLASKLYLEISVNVKSDYVVIDFNKLPLTRLEG